MEENSVDIGIRLLNILNSGAFDAATIAIVGNLREKLQPGIDAYWDECERRESHIVRGYN